MTELLYDKAEWDYPSIKRVYDAMERIAVDEMGLDFYPNQIEVITAEQMLDAYSSVGLPLMYRHWSFGKHFARDEAMYRKGIKGLAYEIVINCLAADTKVMTRQGMMTLAEVLVGDQIWNGSKFVSVKATMPSVGRTRDYLLSNGMSISATDDHVFPVVGPSGFEERRACDIGDSWLMSSCASYDLGERACLDGFQWVPPRHGFGEKYAFSEYCKLPGKMNPELAELMGIIIGDGSITHTQHGGFYVAVGHDNPTYLEHVLRLIKSALDVDARVYERPSTKYADKMNWDIYVCSTEVREFLDHIGLSRASTAKNKKVPWSIWRSDAECRAAFLKGVFDTDGCVGVAADGNFASATVSCINKELASDLIMLMGSLGIPASTKWQTNGDGMINAITMTMEGAVRFAHMIVPATPHKAARLATLFRDNRGLTGGDKRLSQVPSYFVNKYKPRDTRGSLRNSPRRNAFLRCVSLEESDQEKFDAFRFVYVRSVSDYREQAVVDITVESEDHCFVANGILTHNCNPCISYIMEENTMTMQALVIAHAAFGHNHFFKNNHMFRQWTDADGILNYLAFAKRFVQECEERHGVDAVERILDAAHALQSQGVDRYAKRTKRLGEEEARAKEREKYLESTYNPLWSTVPGFDALHDMPGDEKRSEAQRLRDKLGLPEGNILYFIEKNSPKLKGWERELIRIVRKIGQYFYPQRQVKLMNEGCATWVHMQIMTKLHDRGMISDGNFLEFIHSHTSVVTQPEWDKPWHQGWNPYALGYAMMEDIARICTSPTDEDREWFPDIAGNGDAMATLRRIWAEYRDESFVLQYLSPKVIRDFRMFHISVERDARNAEVRAIHDAEGYREVRRKLAQSYDLSLADPDIEVADVDLLGDRRLVLSHSVLSGRKLHADTSSVLVHLKELWGYPVTIVEKDMLTGKEVGRINQE